LSHFGIVLISLAAATVQPAAAERSDPLPPDCLAAGIIEDAGSLLGRTGDILTALGDKTGSASLRAGVGERIGNPALAGVDLSEPVRFFFMNPRNFPHPWVCQFGVSDADALKWALLTRNRSGENGEVFLRLQDGRATWSLDAEAAKGLLQWEEGGGKLPDSRVAGRVRVRVDVRRILSAYNAEFATQLQEMKARMREALGGKPGKPAAQEEASSVQSQLEAAAAALRQVQDVDFGLDITPAFIRLELDARLPQSAPLSVLLRAHAPGDLGLLGLCPPDASLAVIHNLSFVDSLRNALWNAMGLSSPGQAAPVTGAGHRAVALFLAPSETPASAGASGGLRPASRVEILDLRDGAAAIAARQEWGRLTRREAAPATEGPRAFILRPLPSPSGAADKQGPAGPDRGGTSPALQGAPGPAVKEASAEALRLAEVAPDEAVLSAGGMRLFRRFLGNPVLAAQESRGDLCVTAVGSAPAERVKQVDLLSQTKNDSLLASGAFRRSVESLPARPNFLLYVSAEALREWFALAGLSAPGHSPADAMGLAAGAAVGADGVRFTLKIPLGGVLRDPIH